MLCHRQRAVLCTPLYFLHSVVFPTARKLVVDGIVSVAADDTLVSVSPGGSLLSIQRDRSLKVRTFLPRADYFLPIYIIRTLTIIFSSLIIMSRRSVTNTILNSIIVTKIYFMLRARTHMISFYYYVIIWNDFFRIF